MKKTKIMNPDHIYEHIVIGSGISGASIAYHLNKYTTNILILEKENDIAQKASGAAGGFLSPLLGKPNKFKDLVNNAFVFSTSFYKENLSTLINQCGTLRLAKNKNDEIKFKEYADFIDFQYTKEQGGYYFKDASVVNSNAICKALIGFIDIHFNINVTSIEYQDNIWILNDKYYTKNLILSTGTSKMLIDEFYLSIKPIWGQRIEISTTTCISHNYHKECSISSSIQIDNENQKVSIGATHHRFVSHKKIDKNDTQYLLDKASDILKLKDINILNEYSGARAASVDYFPIVGEIIDSKKTIKEFPYLKKGTNVQENRFIKYKNLYILNGLGGRGFVLAPYLSQQLAELIINNNPINDEISPTRLFKRAVKKL
jgi:tRNA 5-methylaminomethyl-2-thiouridine biosynthesis bifunctional protein